MSIQKPDKICLLDMDGVLVNYEKQMTDDLIGLMSESELNELDAMEEQGIPYVGMNLHDEGNERYVRNRMRLIKSQTGWWYNLPPMEDGFQLMNMAIELGFDIHVLTKGPHKTTTAWTEKVEWCREFLPEGTKVTITEDKGLVYGTMLIDDYPDYMDSWLKWRTRGLGIMPLRSYNKDYKHPNVVLYDGTNQEEVKERMKQQMDR